MEPIPQTVEALQELTRLGDETVARILLRISGEVERIVPDIVGISVSVQGDLTFTLTATSGPVAELDGMQYLAGGPCEDTLKTGVSHTYSRSDGGDEERWRVFSLAATQAGVESTLSLPILVDGIPVAGINLYASTQGAFDGHHEELAATCGARVEAAVNNADLGFTTRFQAAETPQRLRDRNLVDQAVGALAAEWEISTREAEDKLRSSAQRAGITDTQMARAILHLLIPLSTSTGRSAPFE
jgi:GAF domain-containing protein